MKVGFAQVAAPTSPGTVNLQCTSAGFTSDIKAAIILASYATADNAKTDQLQMSVGAVGTAGGTTQAAVGYGAQDAVGTTAAASSNNQAKALIATSWLGSDVDIANCSAFGADYLTLNFTTTSGRARLINALLIGGSNVEAKVMKFTWTSSGAALAVAHGLSGPPVALFMLTNFAAPDTINSGSALLGFGFWANAATSGLGRRDDGGLAAASVFSRLSSSAWIHTNADTIAVTSVTSDSNTTVTLTPSASKTQTVYVLAVYAPNMHAATGFFTTPTGIGNAASISGLPFAPQGLVLVGTRQTSIGLTSSDTADTIGIGFGASTGTQGSVGASSDDGAGSGGSPSTTRAKNWTSDTKVYRTLDDAGDEEVVATVNTWDSGGVTFNYSAVGGLAYEAMYLAFQQDAALGAGGGIAKRHQQLTVLRR